MSAARTLIALLLPASLACGLPACDKAEKPAKGDDKQAKKEPEKAPEPAEKPKKLEHPWASDAIPAALKSGTKLTYKQTGKDEEEARKALEAAGGDIAEAIVALGD